MFSQQSQLRRKSSFAVEIEEINEALALREEKNSMPLNNNPRTIKNSALSSGCTAKYARSSSAAFMAMSRYSCAESDSVITPKIQKRKTLSSGENHVPDLRIGAISTRIATSISAEMFISDRSEWKNGNKLGPTTGDPTIDLNVQSLLDEIAQVEARTDASAGVGAAQSRKLQETTDVALEPSDEPITTEAKPRQMTAGLSEKISNHVPRRSNMEIHSQSSSRSSQAKQAMSPQSLSLRAQASIPRSGVHKNTIGELVKARPGADWDVMEILDQIAQIEARAKLSTRCGDDNSATKPVNNPKTRTADAKPRRLGASLSETFASSLHRGAAASRRYSNQTHSTTVQQWELRSSPTSLSLGAVASPPGRVSEEVSKFRSASPSRSDCSYWGWDRSRLNSELSSVREVGAILAHSQRGLSCRANSRQLPSSRLANPADVSPFRECHTSADQPLHRGACRCAESLFPGANSGPNVDEHSTLYETGAETLAGSGESESNSTSRGAGGKPRPRPQQTALGSPGLPASAVAGCITEVGDGGRRPSLHVCFSASTRTALACGKTADVLPKDDNERGNSDRGCLAAVACAVRRRILGLAVMGSGKECKPAP